MTTKNLIPQIKRFLICIANKREWSCRKSRTRDPKSTKTKHQASNKSKHVLSSLISSKDFLFLLKYEIIKLSKINSK